ncbi:MAG: uracil-DNA glycosylase family protein [Planctomycetota bacterium]
MARIAPTARTLIDAARDLAADCDRLRFAPPVTHVYNPLAYARPMHEQYLARFAQTPKRVLLLGMNPGPWGMAQTGVPFGEVAAVRGWMELDAPLAPGTAPSPQTLTPHPKRPLEGLACQRSEVSGRRLWGLMQDRFQTAERFFEQHLVVNYCPLVFMEESARNRTPDKLPAEERHPLETACDAHLRRIVETLGPAFLVGVGKFAQAQARRVLAEDFPSVTVTSILHPSPASPAANRGWAAQATQQLLDAGVWDDA